MTLLFDKHRLIVSPSLAPNELREADSLDRTRGKNRVITIGLVNNMPDPALQATERQFIRLLTAAAGRDRIHFHCFSLPSVPRSQSAKWRVEEHYTDIADLDRLPIDGLIVTGAEPSAAKLTGEAFWRELTDLVDWAKHNTRSAIWSCLAAHAAVLHLDGVERRRLETKCSGIYDCINVSHHWMTDGLPSPFKVAHSRLNELRAEELTRRHYQLLTLSAKGGVDSFAKNFGSEFIFFQGHPEYEALSLEREYLRDVTRFLNGERDSYPGLPTAYFDLETEQTLLAFAARAQTERRPTLSTEFPDRTLRENTAMDTAAAVMFRNWVGFLSERARTTSPAASI
jgi:homoserine O-succinyltransferase/O-acetyltransferase